MAVYVDEPLWESRGLRWCHLMADSPAELQAFAARLGLEPERLQRRPRRPWADHYDLPAHRRRDAVALGARELSLAEAGRWLRRARAASGG
jgi:hypothetical protein